MNRYWSILVYIGIYWHFVAATNVTFIFNTYNNQLTVFNMDVTGYFSLTGSCFIKQ